MTSKKTEDQIPTAENVYEGEKLVAIKLPLTKTERDDVFVRVNRRTWQIKRGEWVRVPECVQQVLDNAEQALEDSILYQEKNQERVLAD